MNPWMLHEVRKDDVASRYKEAERHRLAATLADDSLSDDDPGPPLAPVDNGRPGQRRRARWVVSLLIVAAWAVVMIMVAACGAPATATVSHQPPAVGAARVIVAPLTDIAPLEAQPVASFPQTPSEVSPQQRRWIQLPPAAYGRRRLSFLEVCRAIAEGSFCQTPQSAGLWEGPGRQTEN